MNYVEDHIILMVSKKLEMIIKEDARKLMDHVLQDVLHDMKHNLSIQIISIPGTDTFKVEFNWNSKRELDL